MRKLSTEELRRKTVDNWLTMARCARKERSQIYLRADGTPLLVTPDGTKKSFQDQGWAWVVCFGAFVVNFLTIGQQNSAGVVYSALMNEYSTQRGETAWVASLASSMMYIFAAVAASLTERFGSRLIVIAGSLISAAGLVASSFSPSLQLLYATYGIVWGLGSSLGLFPTLLILTKYFNKRLAVANGIGLAGAAVGSMIFGPFIQVVSSKFGVPVTFRLLAALQSLMFLSALTFRPIPEENLYWKTKIFDCSLFSNKGFIIWTASLSIFMLVFLVPFVHLVSYAEDMGISRTKASFLTSLMAIGIFVGSIIFGMISDFPRLSRLKVCQLTFLSIAVSSTLVSMATKYEWIGLYAFAFGVFDGCYEMLVPVITKDITGARKCAQAIGTLYSFLAFPKTLGPPIAGWIFDAFKSYRISFYVTGAVTTLAVVVTFLLSWFQLENYDKMKKPVTNSNDMLQEPCCNSYTSEENFFYDNSKESVFIERLTVV